MTLVSVINFSYAENDIDRVGVYIAASPLTPEHNYFEVEILDTGIVGAIGKLSLESV